MTRGVATDSVREPSLVAPGAPSDGFELDVPSSQRMLDRAGDVESCGTVRRPTDDRRRVGANTGRDAGEVTVSELVAARMDRRTQHCAGDVLAQFVDSDVEHACGESPPSGVSPDDTPGCSSEEDHSTIGRPHRQVTAWKIGLLNVGDDVRPREASADWFDNAVHGRSVNLVGHRPGRSGDRPLTAIEHRTVDMVRMHVSVDSFGRHDGESAPTDRAIEQRQHVNAPARWRGAS